MDYRKYKNGPEDISLLGFGAMRLPLGGNGETDIDYAPAKQMLDAAWAGGVNYFDTAYNYHGGASESFLGKALAGYDRGGYYLATKMPTFFLKEAGDAPRFFEEQLERLQTDYIDFYLLHALDAGKFETVKKLGVYEYLLEQKKAGRIRRLGFSFHDHPSVLEEICGAYTWDFAQIQLNYFDWEAYKSREQYEILQKHGLPCIVMEPVRGGTLADLGEEGNRLLGQADPGASIASWAVRFAASLPGVLTVLSGMSTLAQVEDNLATFSPLKPLAPGDYDTLNAALNAFRKHFTIPCTGCHYCMPCPQGVAIPRLFSDYNIIARDDDMAPFTSKYSLSGATGDRCTDCGRCVPLCPQHINIPSLLRQLAGATPPAQLQQ